jgi:hypothetical protein
MNEYAVGHLLNTDRGLQPVCPHCQYNGATEPRYSRYPFVLLETMTASRPITIDEQGLGLGESDFGFDYAEAHDPRFLCGDCEGVFALSNEDFQQFREGVDY